jgi:hypothetical protein
MTGHGSLEPERAPGFRRPTGGRKGGKRSDCREVDGAGQSHPEGYSTLPPGFEIEVLINPRQESSRARRTQEEGPIPTGPAHQPGGQ